MNKLLLIFMITVHSFMAIGANIGDDQVNIGQRGSTADKLLIFRDANKSKISVEHTSGNFSFGDGNNTDKKWIFDVGNGASNPFFTWDSTKQKIGFSNDGTSTKDIGSGSGSGSSGINAFTADQNANAEDGTSSWSNVGGTFTTEAIAQNVIEGDQSFSFTPSAQNDRVVGPTLDLDLKKYYGITCEAGIEYYGGDENLELHVVDGNGDILNEDLPNNRKILKRENSRGPLSVSFQCPREADIIADANKGNLHLEIKNVGAGIAPAITWDLTYLGDDRNLGTSVIGGEVGSITAISGSSCSSDYLLADGLAVSRTTYSELFEEIGTTYGVGDGLTTFNLPDLRGVFLRGAGSNGIINANGGSTGTLSEDSFKSHTHLVYRGTYTSGAAGIISRGATGGSTGSEATSATGGSETKPDSMSVNYCIRAFNKVVKTYKAIPVTSETVNEYVINVNADGSIDSSTPIDGINVTRNSNGNYDITYSGLGLTSNPSCKPKRINAGYGDDAYVVGTVNTTSCNVHTVNSSTQNDGQFSVTITRTGADYIKPQTKNLSLAGIAVNSYAEQSQKQVRSEGCTLNASTSPTASSSLCSPWVSSINFVSAGRFKIDFESGTFKEHPVCSCDVVYPSDGTSDEICFTEYLTGPSKDFIEILVTENGVASNGENVNINCIGVK